MSFLSDYDNNHLGDYSKKVEKKNIILPNFIYKNNKIYWNFKDAVIVNVEGKDLYIKEMELGKMKLYAELTILDNIFKCTINEKSLQKGLLVNVEYDNNPKIKDKQLAKLGRLIESNLIDIVFNDYDNMEYKDKNLFYELHNEDDPFYRKNQDNIYCEDEKKYLNALNKNQQQIIDDDDDDW